MKDDNSLNRIEKFFKDDDGNVAIWQFPNVPLMGWLLFKIIGMAADNNALKLGCENLSMAFLFTWAYLEITSGDSRFRKLLGIIVIIWLLTTFNS